MMMVKLKGIQMSSPKALQLACGQLGRALNLFEPRSIFFLLHYSALILPQEAAVKIQFKILQSLSRL